MFHWLKEATRFVKRHQAVLASRPVWLFSSGPLGTDRVDEHGDDVLESTRPKEFDELTSLVHPRGVQVFFGAWNPDAPPVGLVERMVRRLPAYDQTPAGDFRAWPAIDAWAAGVARDLLITEAAPLREVGDMPAVGLRWRARPLPSAGARPWRSQFRTVWAAALAGLLGVLFTGLTAVTAALWATDPAYTQTNPVVDLAFFALGGILITAGFASQIRTPRIAGLQQALLALIVLAVAGWVGGRVEPLVGPLVLLAAAVPLVVLCPERRRLIGSGAGFSRPLAAFAAVGAVPAVVYAASMLDHARASGPSCFLGQCEQGDRYAEAAALALAAVAVAGLAAVRTPGWLLPAYSAAVAAIVLGGASLAFPAQIGALSSAWAAAAVAWGGAFIAVAHAQRRAPPHRQPIQGR